jgi:ABC-type protease/lipase transport system fused ATPase/permease subunit
MDEVEAVIQLLWSGDGSADPEALLPRLQRGGVFVQGRGLRDWDAAAMQRRMVVMKPGDVQLPITIGVLCGIDPAITRGGNPLQSLPEKYRRAVELSGVAEVIRLLPNGINTDLNEVPLLSPGQRYRTSLCRALTALDRDVVLLHLGTEFMGEYEEEKFLATLRAMVRPEQVVIVTSAKLAIANHVDHAVAFERGVAPRTIKARPPPQS